MTPSASSASSAPPGSRLATRLAFFIPGLGLACWAPLVPYAKGKIGLDEERLGLLLLFLGAGSVAAMPLAGGLAARFGSRKVIITGAIGIVLFLPLLAMATTAWELALALLFFGASLGAVDVAANIHGVEVEHRAQVPLMSNFHGFYSIGGLTGSAAMTLLLTRGLPPLTATLCASVFGCLGIIIAAPRLLAARPEGNTPFFVRPHGVVLLIGMLTCIIFLIEGAILDWGAVLLKEFRGVPESGAGIGYVLFSLAMTTGRLAGDAITSRFGGQRVLLGGSILTSLGLLGVIAMPRTNAALAGFFVIGAGAANLVPVLYSAAGRQTAMPKDLAISAISVMGYAGILAGPACIGFVAHLASLPGAFGLLAIAVLLTAWHCRLGTGSR